MRETIARLVCLMTLCLAVALSLLFAARHNATRHSATGSLPAEDPDAVASARPGEHAPPTAVPRGREVFQEQGCLTCHSLRGAGNPRYPLDGVHERRRPEELREWITGAGKAAGELSGPVLKRKKRYQAIPASDMDALVLYLCNPQ